MNYRFMRYPGGKNKAVTFSYDDGVKSDIKLAAVFDKYGIKATFNLCSGWIDRDNRLTHGEIQKYLINKGHEIAIHGANHLAPGKLDPVTVMREYFGCRTELEKMFGRIIRGMAYPNSGIRVIQNGISYEKIRSCLENAGIAYSRTLAGDNDEFLLPQDWYSWMPTAHHENPHIFEYINKFKNIKNNESVYCDGRYPRLFYLWGHSYEFDNNDNWDRIENICSSLGGCSDTWYATNIEIHDYVTAYNSLHFSVDGKRFYNPTCMEIWFEIIGDGIYSVKPGEEIVIG